MVAAQAEVGLRATFSTAEVRFDRQCAGGYIWFFPSGRTARAGVGVPARHAGALRGLLNGFLRYLADEGRIYREGVLGYSGGPVPVGGPPSFVQRDGVLLAGDAAGCADPVTGSGIYAAVLSGSLAGRMASEALCGGGIGHLAGYRRALGRVLGCRAEGRTFAGRLRAWEVPGPLAEKAWGVAGYEEEGRLTAENTEKAEGSP